MKSILSTNPTFTPGAANTGTLNFSSVNGFNIAGLLAVLNQTRGTLLYATGKQPTGYFSWNSGTKVLTLKVDTSTHSSGDQLQVIYDGPGAAIPSGSAQTATFTTANLTNQVVTASPAIFIGLQANSSGYPGQGITVKNGNAGAIIYKDYTLKLVYESNSGYGNFSLAPIGVDCPLGIYIDTPVIGSPPGSFSVSIYYILK